MQKTGILVAMLLGVAGAAQAADVAPATPAPAAPPTTACTNINDFVTTGCPLSWGGVQFYGTIDLGAAYQTHGTPFNKYMHTGIEEFINKNSNKAGYSLAPNGLSQSVVGIKGSEEFAPGWSVMFLAETGFDPYSFQLGDGQKALIQNDGVALNKQTSNADTSRAGQWDNSQGYVGVKSDQFGTLVIGRVNALTTDGVNAYDPMGGSYAFSPIGWSGATVGTGDTEDARMNTAVKYRVGVGPFRAAALVQLGGYAQGNGATEAYQVQAGADLPTWGYGQAAVDAIFSRLTNAVNASPLSAAQQASHPGSLAATLSDNTGVMLLAKYTYGPVKFSGGYEHILYQNPSSAPTAFTSIGGYPIDFVTSNAYTHNKILQVFWGGARYAITDKLDVGAAYYHYLQNSYSGNGCSNTSKGSCSGTMDAVSFDVDYRILPKLDTYAGVMFSNVNGGLASGYLFRNTADPLVGVRFKF